jgi:hypothetical protein
MRTKLAGYFIPGANGGRKRPAVICVNGEGEPKDGHLFRIAARALVNREEAYAFTHFDAWAYGTNLINLALYKSHHNDPATPCAPGGWVGCAGASDFYGSIRSTFGFNEVFNTKAFTVGPLRNVSLEVGADAGVENNPLSPAKRAGVFGLLFAFDLHLGDRD